MAAAASKLSKILEEYTKNRFKDDPGLCLLLGHTPVDGNLPNLDARTLKRLVDSRKTLIKKLKETSVRGLDPEDRLDRELAIMDLQAFLTEANSMPPWYVRPGFYVTTAMDNLFLASVTEQSKATETRKIIQTAAESVEPFLKRGMKNLKSGASKKTPPPLFVDTAILQAQEARRQLEKGFDGTMKTMPATAAKKLRAALSKADEALAEYATFLEEEVKPSAEGTFKLGNRFYELMLKHRHGLTCGPLPLVDLAERVRKSSTHELKKLSRSISPRRTWQSFLSDLHEFHPSRQGVQKAYREALKAVSKRMAETGLIREDSLSAPEVGSMPFHWSPMNPVIAFLPPTTLSDQRPAMLLANEPPPGVPGTEVAPLLRGHCTFAAPIFLTQETFPGRFELYGTNDWKDRPVRQLVRNRVHSNGLGMYFADLLREEGFMEDPRERLILYREMILAACRAIVDISLHTGNMRFQQAVDYLVENTAIETYQAERLVRRDAEAPTEAVTWVAGKYLYERLRRTLQLESSSFAYPNFHHDLMLRGALPFSDILRHLDRPDVDFIAELAATG